MMISWKYYACFSLILSLHFLGCSGARKIEVPSNENRELSLQHFLEGSLLDQKEDYAKAILEYQEALQYYKDPAIYYAIAKDYSILGKNSQAIQMGLEAVRLQPDNRTYHETLAGVYINARDIDNATREYGEIVRIDSQYFEGWRSLASLTQIKKPLQALEIYRRILDRFGPNWDIYFQMAQVYNTLGKLPKAAQALKSMLELDPSNYEIKKVLGDTYLRQDSIETALRIYNELIELYPQNPDLRAALAHVYLMKQDYEHAEEQFEIVLRKDTLSVDEQLQFGQVFVSFIQKDSAVAPYALKLFENIRDTYPSDWRAYWFLGAINNIMKNDSDAFASYLKVKELASWNPEGWIGIATIYYDNNQLDSVIYLLTEAKKFVPEEFRVYFLLGVTYQRQHKQIEAASALEKALQLNGKNIEAMSALALIYDELKRYDDSDSIYEKAIVQDPHNHLLLNNYGYSLADRGQQLERALKMSKEALEQQPNNQSYLDTYGWILYRLGRYKEAAEYILKAVESGSTSAVIHEHLGDVYFRLSDKQKAMEYWEKALKLDNSSESLKDKIQRGAL